MNLAMGEEAFLPFLLRDHTLSKGLGGKKKKQKQQWRPLNAKWKKQQNKTKTKQALNEWIT